MKRMLLAGVALALCTAQAHADAIVVQKGRAFRPREVTINKGETLTFTNEDSYLHQIYVEGLFDSEERAPGQNLNETFPATGTFEVRCHIHPIMRMTVRVK
ncbi:MAG TPA: cupredoxin domain-containing protein [Rhizomicrobium sp.]|jgi:plastocyanin